MLEEMRIKPIEKICSNIVRFMIQTNKDCLGSRSEMITHKNMTLKQLKQFTRLMAIVQKLKGLKKYNVKGEKGNYILFTNKKVV